jgi:hypothetical protein
MRNNWFINKMRLAEQVTANGVNKYIDKATEKFGSLSIKKQCQTYLQLITVNKVVGANVHKTFLAGMKNDYLDANAKTPISIDDWLKQYYDEPLFEKVLAKCKTNREELEATLKA